ncbi:MAG TPA: DUF1552 domain-containing protein [Vicinamibacterales bacterium]|jgi:hypothetical protein|nr:DUF1552 domain-containing protein [Vicinamibacterales bacterium]
MALPLLDAMVPALSAIAKTSANPIRRLGFIYIPNGVAMSHEVNFWKPVGEGTDFKFSSSLAPLEPFRNQTVVISGLSHPQAEPQSDGNGDHTRASVTWLNGVHPKKTESADLRSGVTVDQLAASVLGKETALPSIEVSASDFDNLVGNCENGYSCVYMNSLSWRGPAQPNRAENNPRVVFEELFGDGGTTIQRVAAARQNGSILDFVTADLARLQRSLGARDKLRVDDYLESVREVERRIQRTEALAGEDLAQMPTLERPAGIPNLFGEHVKLMFDLLALAYQADTTRVFTFMMGRELSVRPFPEIGINEGHHNISHHGNRLEQIEKLAKINAYQTTLLVDFLAKLRAAPDGDGSVLDHTLLVYGGGLGNPNEHLHVELPLLLVGGGAGKLEGGRHLVYPAQTMSNLLLSLLDKVGVPAEKFGDSTGRLNPDPLEV